MRYLKEAFEIAPKNVLGLIEDDLELQPIKSYPGFQEFFDELRRI